MDNRLNLIKSMVKPCNCVADVGTDHGYLVVALVLAGIAKDGIATDINQMPLDTAIAHIATNGLDDRIRAVCTDGLTGVDNKPDAVTIAGMGGELIAHIIDSWEHSKRTNVDFYLQPMTKVEKLRDYFYENGYQIIEEKCCVAANRPYSVMHVKYVGEENQVKIDSLYVGSIRKPYTTEDIEYLSLAYRRMRKKIDGMKTSLIEKSEISYWENEEKKMIRSIDDESITSI